MEEGNDDNGSGDQTTATYALKGTNLTPLPPKFGASNKYLASTLLHDSLLSSLGRVLQYSESGITLDSALALADLPTGGEAIIAGSTIAQACLGELWGEEKYGKTKPSDVDVYCTAKAAPLVRSVSRLMIQSSGKRFVWTRLLFQ